MDNLTHCGTIEIATERLYLKRIEKCDATSMHSDFADEKVYYKQIKSIYGTEVSFEKI